MAVNNRIVISATSIILVGLTSNAAFGTIRYVKQGGTGNGANWTTPYGNPKAALAVSSSGDEVWVASGTYKPGDDPADSFQLVSGVEVVGGFFGIPGTENDPDARDSDPTTNDTVLSGDLGADGHSRVVVTATYVNVQTVLDGFTITGGKGGPAVGSGGAGIYVGISGNATFQNCLITGNEMPDGGWGGGMCIDGGAEPTLVNCTFRANRAGYGGGLIITQTNLQPEIRQCTFVGNIATFAGGGLHSDCSGDLVLYDCIFAGNAATNGGGMVNGVYAQVELVNNLFTGNIALNNGGGIDDQDIYHGVTLRNCTLSANTCLCGEGGGIRLVEGTEGDDILVNSIFWGNSDIDGSDEDSQVRASGTPDITYCCIEGWTGGGTNIGTDPEFMNPDGPDGAPGTLDDDLRPIPRSAAIDAGDNSAVTVDYDLDGKDREVDGDGDQTADVDMGSYEYDGVDEDCNENTEHDLEDIYDETSADCNDNLIPDECDIDLCLPSEVWCQDENENGVPDGCDIAGGTSNDCNDNGIPDETEFTADCNANCVEDSTEITADPDLDADDNGILDECEYPMHGVWQEDDDFDEGTPINVNYEDVADQLQRNPIAQDGDVPGTKPLPYLWVAASGNGTVVRIRTEDEAEPGTGSAGDILGEYHTAPRLHVSAECVVETVTSNPSRTTVDLDGSMWAANRSDDTSGVGSVVKVGLVVGGTRVDADGTENPDGQYLAPPYDYCTCEDRDGDGLIRTSRGLGDILPWDNWDGADDAGAVDDPSYVPGVGNAEDECVIRYVRVAGTGTRTVAINKDNNVWVGGFENREHEQLDGFSGLQIGVMSPNPTCGGYGGLITYTEISGAFHELLWSAGQDADLLCYDASTQAQTPLSSHGNYGLGFDPLTGRVWHSSADSETLYEINPVSHATEQYDQDFYAKGVAVDCNGDVWVAEADGDEVLRLNADPTDPYDPHTRVGTLVVGNGATGVAVDGNGKIWVSERHDDTVSRIDPTVGVGTVDLTVELRADADPYNYSDMTGMVGLHTSGVGTWSVVHDGGIAGTEWCLVRWNEDAACDSEPDDGRLMIEVRAADHEAGLAAVPYAQVQYVGGEYDALADIPGCHNAGRYLQVRVRFQGTFPGVDPFVTPVLCDLTVIPFMDCEKGDLDFNGVVNGLDIQPFIDVLLDEDPPSLPEFCAADTDYEGDVDVDDIPCFVRLLLGQTPSCSGACDGDGGRSSSDCNENGVYDINDIAMCDGSAWCKDCNDNLLPDECDIALCLSSETWCRDLNENDIPDGCDPDCNENDIPDDKDIADETSDDCNENGIPDECEYDCNDNGVPDDCDISEETSDDCNENGTPDECEYDCNANGVPDDCDIDPSDPDGDEEVSEDCNENGIPDECDLSRPLFPSFDCNDNLIPDECDLADCLSSDPSCQDCNENGFLDGCDIEWSISEDENENGIPDECEGGRDGGGGGGGGDEDADTDEAWGEFIEWSLEQEWGPTAETSGAEQFKTMVDKLKELGLPLKSPWR